MKSKIRFFCFVVTILLMLCQVSSISQEKAEEAWTRFKSKYDFPGLQVTWNKQAGVPSKISGLLVSPPTEMKQTVQVEDALEICMDFLEKNRELFNVPQDAVKRKKIWKYQNKLYVILQTYYEQIPIYNGKVGLTLDEQGRILTYSSDYNPKMELDITPTISKDQAIKIAFQKHKPELKVKVSAREAYLTIFQESNSNEDTIYKLAWYVFLGAEIEHYEVDKVFIIDAKTGKIIKEFIPYPFAITGIIRGEVYPEHSTDPISVVPFVHESVAANGTSINTDANGNYALNPGTGNYTWETMLEGPFVQVQSWDAATFLDQDIVHAENASDPGTLNFTWTALNCAPDDGDGLTVFWQANRLHDDYYHDVLGINWIHNWSGSNQMRYSVNRGTANNAYAGNPIKIYSDAAARNSDVVFHETTHNVLYDMFGGSYIGWPNAYSEGYAFDEGFADYVACSFNNDSILGENVITTRNCNNTMQYPGTTYNIEGHTGGQLISGVAWDLWNKQGLNHNDADVLLFAGLSQMATLASPYYFSNPNQSNYLDSLLIADDDNNNVFDGTPHDRQIYQAFRYHDLLPVDVFCKDSPQDVGNIPCAGNHWTSPDIWVRNSMDGGSSHQNPIYNQANYIYIRVHNLGYLTANQIKLKAYWADPASGIPWPSDWNYIGETSVNNLVLDSETVANPIAWTPTGTAIGHRCLLVRLECNQDMITEEGIVKEENNIAQKNISIVNFSPSPIVEIPPKPKEIKFFIKNYQGKIDLFFTARQIKPRNWERFMIWEDSNFPFEIELETTQIKKFLGTSGLFLTTEKVFRPFWPFKKRILRFSLRALKGKISGVVLNEDRAIVTIRFIPKKQLREHYIYELTIRQNVNSQVVGGLTYLIRID